VDTRSFNRALGDHGSDNWSSTSHAGECFAFGGTDDQVWARTDAEDGYKYIMSAAWRTAQGCTTS